MSPLHQGEDDPKSVWRRSPAPPIAGLYLHIPFCFHKCHYCDFYSIVDSGDRQAAFARRMAGEIADLSREIRASPRTIFVGGGTPTLLKPELWSVLLKTLSDSFDLSALVEFTVEANPETVSAPLMKILFDGGVNRVSLGAQSFNPSHLKTLERWHDPASVARAVATVRDAGIQNINLDLIFAIPGQSLDEQQDDLRRALELRPTHLSCYSLTFEPNTPLTEKLRQGRIERADNGLEADMFRTTIATLTNAGFEHYEISNFALPGKRCEHNLLYWRNENWLAIGPSASGHVAGVRWKNVPHLGKYLAGNGAPPVQDVERLDAHASLGEELMMRFRLLEGIENAWLLSRLDDSRQRIVASFVRDGWMEKTPTHTRLTPRGLMIADGLLGQLI